MYPASFFSLSPPFPREPQVFVAMSFAKPFVPRWENVIEPAIVDARKDAPLAALRLDTQHVNDSILTEILQGISTCTLFFADVTALEATGRPANVMYELGLAHAVRLPEEVLLFRSDDEPLPFDIATLRVHDYDPDSNPASAREVLRNAVSNALGAVDRSRLVAVQRAAHALDPASWWLLAEISLGGDVETRRPRPIVPESEHGPAVQRLLEIGAIGTHYAQEWVEVRHGLRISGPPTDYTFRFETKPFGHAVLHETMKLFDLSQTTLQTLLDKRAAELAAWRSGQS